MTPDYQTIYRLLAAHYGEPQWAPDRHKPPLDELVATILSQATSDRNRDLAFARLQRHFPRPNSDSPDWYAVMNAPLETVIEAIRPAGLANQKAPRIQAALRTIYQQRGSLDLDFLADIPLEEAKKWLTQIKGIGPKTAAIVLLFAFGRPTFPVDTHVHRILRRVGLIGAKVTADKAHTIMENMGDPATFYAFHLNLIRLGREICRARQPQCARCPLQHHCRYYRQQTHPLKDQASDRRPGT